MLFKQDFFLNGCIRPRVHAPCTHCSKLTSANALSAPLGPTTLPEKCLQLFHFCSNASVEKSSPFIFLHFTMQMRSFSLQVNMFTCLAYSPERDVVETFNMLKMWNNLHWAFADSPFITYVEDTWIGRPGRAARFPPALWNLYQS